MKLSWIETLREWFNGTTDAVLLFDHETVRSRNHLAGVAASTDRGYWPLCVDMHCFSHVCLSWLSVIQLHA
jgi:hypothetical protein